MKKVVFTIVTTIFMCILLLSSPFSKDTEAATSGETGDCSWKLEGTVLTISGNGKMGDYTSSYYVPWGTNVTAVIIRQDVTSIGNYAFSGCSGLTSIEIPSSVTSIGEGAFYNCSGLTSIELPSSVTSIGSYVFRGCSGLTSIEIPSGVTSIGSSAFKGCSGLEEITLPFVGGSSTSNVHFGYIFGAGSAGYNSSHVPSSLKKVVITNATKIFNEAFYGCSGLTSIEIPSGVTSIGLSAFSGCSGLTSIKIPSGVTSIGSSAFKGCSSLEEITLPFVGGSSTSNTYFGYIFGASSYSSNSSYVPDSLKKVIITNATSIGTDAFYECSELTSIEIPNSVTSIGSYAFSRCRGLTSIEIPRGVTSIASSTFKECSGLTNIEIPRGVTSIGSSAFYGCRGLTSIEIPSSVTSIGSSAFEGCSGLTSIKIPSGVTSIGSSTFKGCSGLTSIEIPSSVTSIGSYAFSGCSGLTSVEIPNSVTSIDSDAFSGCSGLEEITLPFVGGSSTSNTHFGYIFGASSCGSNSSYVPSSLKKVIITNATSIGADAFYNCSGLTSIEIPRGVTSIGADAFYKCTSLEEITLPFVGGSSTSNVHFGYVFGASSYSSNSSYVPSSLRKVIITNATSIGNYAFYNCSGLTSIEIPSSATSIGNYAFYNCSGLTSIEIPSSVTNIGSSAFYNCSGLTSIEIPSEVISIGASAFYNCSNLEEITLPDSVETIGLHAFYGCSRLTSIEIPSGVTSIGSHAFYGCSRLTSIEIPSSVTSIGYYAFYNCSGLTSIEIPSGVTSIGLYAFEGCSNLKSVYITDLKAWFKIMFDDVSSNPLYYAGNLYLNGELVTKLIVPSSVTSIGSYAFSGCSGLTSIEIPSGVTSIGSSAFSGCSSLEEITLPFVGGSSTSNTHFGYIFGASSYSSNSSYVPSSLKKVIITNATSIGADAFYNCSGLTSIEIPSGVTSIGSSAFSGCTGLTSIEIPSRVTSIGSYAFEGCSGLTSIKIPSGVTSIGSYAFEGCSGLTSIEIPSSVTSIGSYAFYGCSGLKKISLPDSVETIGSYAFYNCSGITSLILPSYLQYIEQNTFSGCSSLSSIAIPKSISVIYENAFFGCSRLTDIWYQGTKKQSGNIAIYEAGNSRIINTEWHYSSYAGILIDQFVTRLYNICLNREPDESGKLNWIDNLQSGRVTGIQAANGFIFSKEFKNKNYCNEDYVKQLYRAFMGREADPSGLDGWIKNLNSGMTREAVFNGFALSKEFRNICADYGIKVGSAIKVSKYGTVPTGCCQECGVEDGVTQFVKRLYDVCLGREADAGGLASWSKQLWNHTSSGRKVAHGFIFSKEFTNKNYSNEEFVKHLYRAFMGREADAGGLAGWVKNLERGMTRKQVFDGFAGSKEFTNICNKYGILRD